MRIRIFGLLMLIGVGVLPLGVAGWFTNRRAQRTALDAIRAGNQRVAERAARRIAGLVEAERDRLRASASGVAPAVAASPEQAERIAKNFLILFPHLRTFDIIKTGPGCPEIATARLDGRIRGRCGEPAVDTALAGKVHTSDVALSADFAPALTIGVPLELAGEPIGAAVAELDLVGLWPAVKEVRVGERGYARLVSQGGVLVAHGDPEERRRVFLREKDSHVAQVVAAGAAGARYRDAQGRDVLALGATVPELGWTVIVEQPVAEAFEAAELMRRDVGIIVVVAVVLALIFGLTFGRRPVQALEDMRLHANEIAKGNLESRVATPPPIEELRLLADSLNEMASELKRLQEELKSRERLGTFARVAAGLAHDLQQPINAIRASCDLALSSPDSEEARSFVRDAYQNQIPRLDKYVRDLRRISQDGKIPLELATVDPLILAKRIAADAAINPRWPGVEFKADGTAAAIMVDESLIMRAVTNLVGNAGDATVGRKPARVTIEVSDPDPDTLAIAVRDTGEGMSSERLAQVFSHDFKSNKRGSGIGLGLGVAKQVAAAHGGTISAESREGEGTVFRIVLPRPRRPEVGLQRSSDVRSGSPVHAS